MNLSTTLEMLPNCLLFSLSTCQYHKLKMLKHLRVKVDTYSCFQTSCFNGLHQRTISDHYFIIIDDTLFRLTEEAHLQLGRISLHFRQIVFRERKTKGQHNISCQAKLNLSASSHKPHQPTQRDDPEQHKPFPNMKACFVLFISFTRPAYLSRGW